MIYTMKLQLEDTIFIKHGLNGINIKRQVKHYDLDNDTEV